MNHTAQLGMVTATCNECGATIETPPLGSEIRVLNGRYCVVVELDSADLELHMMEHGA